MPSLVIAAMRQDINGKVIDILPYIEVKNHVNFWKLIITDEQAILANEIKKDNDIFLNLDILKTKDVYFENIQNENIIDLSENDVFIKDENGQYIYFRLVPIIIDEVLE